MATVKVDNDAYSFREAGKKDGLVFGYGHPEAGAYAKSSRQPMLITETGAPFNKAQIEFIKKTFGAETTISEDRKSILLPMEFGVLTEPKAENLFHANSHQIAGLASAGASQSVQGMKSFKDFISNPRGADLVGSFDFGSPGAMNKYVDQPLRQVPADLLVKAEEMGRQIIKLADVTQMKEFAGADILTGGKPDPKKVGGILLAAASFQEIYNKKDGPFVFDNELTFTDVGRLNDPELRKYILDKGKDIAASMGKTRTSSVDQGFAQLLADAGFHDKNSFVSEHNPAARNLPVSKGIEIG